MGTASRNSVSSGDPIGLALNATLSAISAVPVGLPGRGTLAYVGFFRLTAINANTPD
jgi:hypothetical protein